MIMDRKEGRMSIDVDRLGVDWDRQAQLIASRAGERRHRPSRNVALAAAASLAAAATILLVLMWPGGRTYEGWQDMDAFMRGAESVSTDYVPEGLYVLNGFDESGYEESSMMEFIIHDEGAKEDL